MITCFKRKSLFAHLFLLMLVSNEYSNAQQFNSDSYISKPHGVVTTILTTGERNTMFMNTFSLIRKWEFTVAAYIYNNDDDPTTDDGYYSSLYAKYMFYENAKKTGGFAMKAGYGLDPGYLDGENRVNDASKTYWTNAPATIPFFDNKLSWDLMPGASMTQKYGANNTTHYAFTYSTRLAWYPHIKFCVVGEVFGAEGGLDAKPEYKAGFRYEPNQYVVIAGTYGDEFEGSNGAGFEIGVMLFSPPFLYLGKHK